MWRSSPGSERERVGTAKPGLAGLQVNAERERFEILDVLHRYCHAYDEGDVDVQASLFVEDARFRFEPPIPGVPSLLRSRSEIHAAMSGRKSATAQHQRRHIITNVLFDEVGEDHTSVRSYLSLVTTNAGKLTFLATGVYRDRLRKTSEGWRFESRHMKLDSEV